MHPHPLVSQRSQAIMLFVLGNSVDALERVAKLFPLRTGVAAPSWIVTSKEADVLGAAGIYGAGVWNNKWRCDSLSSID